MFVAAKLAHLGGQIGFYRLCEGQRASGFALILQRVTAHHCLAPVFQCQFACGRQGYRRGAAQPEFAALAANGDALHPLLRTVRLHPKEKALPVKMLAGFRDGIDKPRGQRLQWFSYSPVCHTRLPLPIPHLGGDYPGICRKSRDNESPYVP